MISVILAAALSVVDLRVALQADAMWQVAEGLKLEDRYLALGAGRRLYCRMQDDATDGAFKLRAIRVRGWVVLLDDDLVAKNDGKPVYQIPEVDLKEVDLAVIDAERQSARFKSLCRG